ncbi:PBECR2 nuclease fold domain-containing protein [Sedimentibacter sp.]|uniref:PBECR3 domain-containing polyvalent protein n=1 Tax=Sedimentibacter sp. TaxID=1960295 RepID=UPI00289963D1|nr:PBECR2 nuclease fold domain-containing protein [Sedimentibacter sp.]
MKQVGRIHRDVLKILNIDIKVDTPIYLGESNINHMKNKHLDVYEKYKDNIEEILSEPDYIGLNNSNNSIEYVKEFNTNNEFVKIAVRISMGEKYYVRTMYLLNSKRVFNFINKGCLKSLT